MYFLRRCIETGQMHLEYIHSHSYLYYIGLYRIKQHKTVRNMTRQDRTLCDKDGVDSTVVYNTKDLDGETAMLGLIRKKKKNRDVICMH